MIKRTVEISQEARHLAVRNDQLVIARKSESINQAPRIPCEDIGLVLVDHTQVTYTHSALVKIVEHGGALIVCGGDHLPAGILIPASGHTEVAKRLRSQITASKPLQKRLWKQIVQSKIREQAANLLKDDPARLQLLALARDVLSGDTSNHEAQAAKVYWSRWLHDRPFRRSPDADGANALLNYGYSIMRAAVARALVGAGLHPTIGIHHHNRSNAFALADDLVEPLRPAVDARVRDLMRRGQLDLDQATKASLLDLLTADVNSKCGRSPLMVALHRYVASLAHCLESGAGTLDIPSMRPLWHS